MSGWKCGFGYLLLLNSSISIKRKQIHIEALLTNGSTRLSTSPSPSPQSTFQPSVPRRLGHPIDHEDKVKLITIQQQKPSSSSSSVSTDFGQSTSSIHWFASTFYISPLLAPRAKSGCIVILTRFGQRQALTAADRCSPRTATHRIKWQHLQHECCHLLPRKSTKRVVVYGLGWGRSGVLLWRR